MSSTRLPTDLEIEDLLAALKESSDSNDELVLSDVASFLSAFKIVPGKHLVRYRLLLELYRLWSKDPVTTEKFEVDVNKFLLGQKYVGLKYYYIDQSAFVLSAKAQALLEKRTIDKSKSPRYKRHFESFLNKHSIKPGKYWVESYLLYYLYDMWAGKKPLAIAPFESLAKLYFQHKRRTDLRLTYFAVDESILNVLPEEHMEQLRQSRKKPNEKKDKTKHSKVPRPSS
jgi:hypothetical protein